MRQTSAEHQIQRILIFLTLVALVVSLYFDSFLTPQALDLEPTQEWEGPWELIQGEVLLDSDIYLPYAIEGKLVGKEFILRAKLPAALDAHINTLAIDTSMTSLRAEIDGQTIYEFAGPKQGWKRPVFGGAFTHFIRLDSEHLDKELSLFLSYTSNNAFAGNIRPILLGSKASLIIAKSAEWPSLFFGFSLLLLGLLITLFSLAIQTTEERKSFFYFGWVLLLLGGWVFSQTPSKFLIIRNPALPMNFSFASLYLLPLFLTNYILHSYPVRRTIKQFQRISLLFVLLYLVAVLLQIAGTMQLTDLLLVSGICLALFLISLFSFILYEFIQGNKELGSFILALSCLLTSILAEVVLLILHISLESAVILHAGMALAAAVLFMHSVTLVRRKTQVLCKEELLRSLAFTDTLTQVGSRAAYELELQRITNSMTTEPLGILMMDINDLKKINDTHGHTKGDSILKDFSLRLMKLLPHDSKVFRYGGDEFIAFIPRVSEDQLTSLANKVFSYFHMSNKTDYQVAVGFDRYIPKKKEKITKVISRADEAMYRTKSKMKEQKVAILT